MRYYGGAVVTAADFGGATYLGTVSGDLLKFKGGALANLGDFGDIAYASASHQGRAYFGFGEGRLLSYNGTDFREEERQPEGLYALFPYGGALYAVVVGGTANTAAVAYELHLDLITPDPCSPDGFGDIDGGSNNDLPASALLLEPLPSGAWPHLVDEAHEQGGISLCATDDDWYQIPVPAGVAVLE